MCAHTRSESVCHWPRRSALLFCSQRPSCFQPTEQCRTAVSTPVSRVRTGRIVAPEGRAVFSTSQEGRLRPDRRPVCRPSNSDPHAQQVHSFTRRASALGARSRVSRPKSHDSGGLVLPRNAIELVSPARRTVARSGLCLYNTQIIADCTSQSSSVSVTDDSRRGLAVLPSLMAVNTTYYRLASRTTGRSQASG